MPERLIKSKERVKNFAEVFTPEWVVKDMCDVIEEEATKSGEDAFDIGFTFLEPSCGNGNFIVEIMVRKYKRCKNPKDGLKALASVVGIDIQEDNCVECRQRLLGQYMATFADASDVAIEMASAILQNNIICGDSLEIQRQWIEQNENIEHDNRIPAIEWCRKCLPKLDKLPKKRAEQLSLFAETKPPLFAEAWQIFDTARIDEIDL